ncbi:hypothetical protein V6N11_021922 [Hibiscus sabdariffa]|uniref:snRNA-activating protein complex subunit 3 n=1 Tax=Hibiscus sabdariffa TaxID=183260 RepID=A0ABR2TIE9_9ROSI
MEMNQMNMIEAEANCSIPKGGPIYISKLLSPLTSVPEFQNVVLRQLQELEVELNSAQLMELQDIWAISKISDCAIPSTFRFMSSCGKAKSADVKEHTPMLYPETVLCVEVYHNIWKWSKVQEFLVLGRQTLTELKDKICCLTDQVMQKAGHYDPSGYFLIEDTLFNDMRDSSAINYSEPILDWLRNSPDDAMKNWENIITGDWQQKQKSVLGGVAPSRLPHFKSTDMHKTRFCDFRFQLGAGYLYCHQVFFEIAASIRIHLEERQVSDCKVSEVIEFNLLVLVTYERAKLCSEVLYCACAVVFADYGVR